MAAPTGSSDSESTGDEEWERFREAVWDAAGSPRAAASLESSGGRKVLSAAAGLARTAACPSMWPVHVLPQIKHFAPANVCMI